MVEEKAKRRPGFLPMLVEGRDVAAACWKTFGGEEREDNLLCTTRHFLEKRLAFPGTWPTWTVQLQRQYKVKDLLPCYR